MKNDFWRMLKEYPAAVSEAFRLATGTPRMPELRVDPEGERKQEERHAQRRAWAEESRRSGIPEIQPDGDADIPLLRTIHLQWHDLMYDVWHDTDILIDSEAIRIYRCESWMLGRQHTGSGAIGVVIFVAPVLLVSAPYLWAKSRLMSASERKHGMSRHAIALMRELEGKIDPEDEALLRAALKNEWTEQERLRAKFGSTPSFEEACALLDECALRIITHRTHLSEDQQQRSYHWIDGDGDHIGRSHRFSGEKTLAIQVKNALFQGEEAEELMRRFKSCTEE